MPREGCEAPPRIALHATIAEGRCAALSRHKARSYTNPRSLTQTPALGLANGWGEISARQLVRPVRPKYLAM